MHTFTAPSGAEVIVNPAPWKDAKALKKAIQREVTGLDDINGDDIEPKQLARLVLQVDGSDAVDAALWPCLIRCTRGGLKIVEDTFNDPEARKDYYEIVLACAKENLGPLVESLFSKLCQVGIVKTKKQAVSSDTPV